MDRARVLLPPRLSTASSASKPVSSDDLELKHPDAERYRVAA